MARFFADATLSLLRQLFFDKPDENVHRDTAKDEGRAMNVAIIARTVTVRTKHGDSLEAPILMH